MSSLIDDEGVRPPSQVNGNPHFNLPDIETLLDQNKVSGGIVTGFNSFIRTMLKGFNEIPDMAKKM